MEQLGRLASGQVVVDRPRSHLHPEVIGLLPEALSRISLDGDEFTKIRVDFGRVIGVRTCVETTDADQILYAQRPKRWGLTRFVLNREPEPCSSVVVILKWVEDKGCYLLITAFIGELSEPEPWDRNATPESTRFWSSHALIWGSEPVVPGTLTSECPW